jgi:hypothetical protein
MKAKVKDEYSLYILIFAILMIDIDIKQNKKNLDKIDTLFYDLLIIIKNMNDGSSFDNNFALELFKFSKNIGFINTNDEPIGNKQIPKLIGLYKNGKYKEYE